MSNAVFFVSGITGQVGGAAARKLLSKSLKFHLGIWHQECKRIEEIKPSFECRLASTDSP